jgi:hypothetical protein
LPTWDEVFVVQNSGAKMRRLYSRRIVRYRCRTRPSSGSVGSNASLEMSESYIGADFRQHASSSRHRRRPIFFAPKNQPILQIERVTGVFSLQGFGPQSDKNVSRETFL